MSGIISEAVDTAENIAETLIEDAEHILQPRPGGKVDTARRNAERQSLDELPVAEQDYLVHGRLVGVDSVAPNTGTARTITLSANNPVLPLLPRDTTRRSAVILAVDNDVYMSNDAGQAMTAAASGGAAAEGVFYLPKGIALPWQNTCELWAAATTTGTSSRVSVMASFKGTR